jgi:hypothetical protein
MPVSATSVVAAVTTLAAIPGVPGLADTSTADSLPG